jgi:imidazolonepropionase-like amidohydrolase
MSRFTLPHAAALGAAMAFAGVAAGQSRQIPAPPQDKPIVVHSATVHTVSGQTIANGYVVFENGVVSAVGQGPPPAVRGAVMRDATGLHVYPGLIAADTTLGLTETGSVDVTQDMDEFGDFTPEARCVIAINPDSDLIPVTRANGILTALTSPSGGVVTGRNALIRLDGWTWEDMAIDAEAGLVMSWPRSGGGGFRGFGGGRPPGAPGAPGGGDEDRANRYQQAIDEIERFFDDSLAYAKAKANDETLETDLRFEAMRPYVLGEDIIFISASTQEQIESAVAFAQRRGLRIVIVGGQEADRAATMLAKYDVPVIIGGLHRMPSARHAAYDEPFTLPLRLHEAGVRFCIASGAEAAHERNLNHVAATAAAYGLPREIALRSVTVDAAEILGVGDKLGSIDIGKRATLIVTTGDPLEITTDVIMAYIDGRQIDLGSRHKSLYMKYREKYRQLGLIE